MPVPRDKVFTVAHMEVGALRRLAPLLDRVLGLRTLARLYATIPDGCAIDDFLARVLEVLDVRLAFDAADLDRVPKSGPAVVVANHPYGGIEGVALAHLLRGVRTDVRVMANYLLGRIPELEPLFFLVDPFDSPGAARRNVGAIRHSVRHVSDGGMLVVFPAGEVAHLDLGRRRVEDPPWDPTVGRVIRRAGCPVLPVRFAGRNRALFQLVGLLHPGLRTAMLGRELVARRGDRIGLRIGSLLAANVLAEWPTDDGLIAFLRRRTELLGARGDSGTAVLQGATRTVVPVAPPPPPAELAAEVAALAPDQCLVDGPNQAVYVAEAGQIPRLLDEIGRLREISFRAVGEGSGRALDLDRYDRSYHHLFVWNREPAELVGAYRVGFSDRLLAEGGVEALYTASLFRFDPRLFEAMGPALELGRSFIRIERQRSFNGLMMLWKGIGELVLRNPSHHTLFGPVSISADYLLASQQMLVSFLKHNSYGHEWSRWVEPCRPFRSRANRNFLPSPADLRSLDEVSQFISEVEADRKGVPILLKQYLKLGGRLLGFNVDPDFSNVLDVLLMVDLHQTDPAILARYMGRERAEAFLSREAGVAPSRAPMV